MMIQTGLDDSKRLHLLHECGTWLAVSRDVENQQETLEGALPTNYSTWVRSQSTSLIILLQSDICRASTFRRWF